MSDITITLPDEAWMMVISGLVRAAQLLPAAGLANEVPAIAAVGRRLSEACPEGSGAWFGAALLPAVADE